MATRNLTEAILDGGIHSVNFFNGRLLSGEDLSQEQVANAEERKRLGQAIGDGIVNGLEVAPSTTPGNTGLPRVTVQPGLAINRLGQTLMLTSGVEISLVAPSTTTTTSTASLFVTCTPPQSGPYVAGAGVYLLTIAPAFGFDGRAPVSALNVPGATYSTCGSKDVVEGVKFGLVWLDINNLPGISDTTRTLLIQLMSMTDLASLSKLRNLLAHLCFGTEQQAVLISDPFSQANKSPITDFGVLATLRSLGNLTNCDVPLALLYWTTDGLQFVDLGSVRRRITRPSADTNWPLFISDRRLSEAEAMFLQFEEHIQDIVASGPNTLSTFAATQHFAYLPPVGLLPMQRTGSAPGFDPAHFFGSLASSNLETTDGNLLRTLMHEAMYHEPINLSDTSRVNRIQLYIVWENAQAFASQATDQLVFVFASHTLPYRGVARFGYARWHLSRFASLVF